MIAAIVLGLIIAAVVAGVVVAVEKNKSSSASANLAAADQTSSSSTSSEPTYTGTATSSAVQPTATVVSNESRNQPTGGNGSIVYLDDGSSFIYNNSFGACGSSSISSRFCLHILDNNLNCYADNLNVDLARNRRVLECHSIQ
jgi:type II secretory pathway pseudopilin PulG